MKTKKIFSLTLICMLLASIIFGGTDVSAKAKKEIKVTYKGKTVTLIDNSNTAKYGRSTHVTFAKCEKAWGKAKKKKQAITTYTWKTKKTKIELTDFDAPAGAVGGINVLVKDKNGSIAGIKVGMTEKKAIQKLKKTFGARNVKTTNKKIYVNATRDSYEIGSGKVIHITKGSQSDLSAGVKVGMSEKEALSRLKKRFGSSKVSVSDKFITIDNICMNGFTIDKGKIIQMSIFRS